jgi:hypothetical protein
MRTPKRTKAPGVLIATVLLTACAVSPRRSSHGEFRYTDTETAGRLRHAAAAGEAASSSAPATSGALASQLARFVPGLLAVLESDNAVGELEEQLVECARKAERDVNSSLFSRRSPSRQDCSEVVAVDPCGNPITRAMQLGQQKHLLALQCAQEVLQQLWPAPFSIEQRYRYYPHAQVLETVSREEEQRLIAQNCTGELWRTIKPDIVLHSDRNLLRSVLTLDFKFPCPETNTPRWTRYGRTSAYDGYTQDQIYTQALGGETMIVSPQAGIIIP